MKVALIGATGFVGGKILEEALSRGCQVTAIVRNAEALPIRPGLTSRSLDVADTAALAEALSGHDAVISSFGTGRNSPPGPEVFERFVAAHRSIIDAVKRASVSRYLAVGGAASLKTRDGVEYLRSPEWPEHFKPFEDGIRGTREQYYMLKEEPELDWVFLAPSVMLQPGERTGKYRTGGDHILYGEDGESRISVEDYAVAMIDELERPAHHRERFTVGY
jgi:uncharacterized protein